MLAPTVDLVGLYAIFSRDEDDYVRDGDEIRGFETREDAEAFILNYSQPLNHAPKSEMAVDGTNQRWKVE